MKKTEGRKSRDTVPLNVKACLHAFIELILTFSLTHLQLQFSLTYQLNKTFQVKPFALFLYAQNPVILKGIIARDFCVLFSFNGIVTVHWIFSTF
jgi:hypothetical protein